MKAKVNLTAKLSILLILFVGYISTQAVPGAKGAQPGSSSQTNIFCSYNGFRNFKLTGSLLTRAETLCNYYVYNGATLSPKKGLIIDGAANFEGIKQFNNNSKVLLYTFLPVAQKDLDSIQQKDTRQSLIKLIIQQLRSHNLDGIGLHSDFVFNINNKNKPTVTADFIQDFRVAINEEAKLAKRPRLLVTIYSSKINSLINAKVNFNKVAEDLDWILVSNDNYFEPVDQLNALRDISSTARQTRDKSFFYTDDVYIKYFLNQGIKSEKLIFVLFTYGYEFTLSDPLSRKGSTAAAKTVLQFFQICEKLKSEIGWSLEHIKESAAGTYAYKGDHWIVFSDFDTFRTKTKYAVKNHLGGVVIVIPDDDFTGKCYDKVFPLTEAVKEVIESYDRRSGTFSKVPGAISDSCRRPDDNDFLLFCSQNKQNIPCNEILTTGTTVRFKCKPNFRIRNYKYSEVTCKNGQWSHPLPTCIPACGATWTIVETLINEGEVETFGKSPWYVAIYDVRNPEDKSLICGGTLVHDRVIVSAAHCFYDESNEKKQDPSNYEIVVSKQTREYDTSDNRYQRAYKLSEIRFPERDFLGKQSYYLSDIALLITEKKIRMNQVVFPACLNLTENEFIPKKVNPGKVVGFGINKYDTPSSILLKATLPYISYESCRKQIGKEQVLFVTQDKFCAGHPTGPGVRKGDSGGGLLFSDSSNSLYYLRGIVSTRPIHNESSSIAIFTDVSKYSKWIWNTMKEMNDRGKVNHCNGTQTGASSCLISHTKTSSR